MLRKIFSLLAGCLFLTIVSNAAYSYQTKSGDVSGQTWENDTYYISGSVQVSDNQTLTINAGSTVQTVVKFAPGTYMYVYGTLDVNGTDASHRVVFTSKNDNTYGDIIAGSSGSPAAGDWGAIRLYGSGANDGIGDFDWAEVRYGGYGSYGNVEFDQSDSGHFTNSISEYSSTYGVKVLYCSPTITDSTINNNSSYGLDVSGTGSAPTITNNTFTNNTSYPVRLNANGITFTAYSGNSFSGNSIDGFVVTGQLASDNTWSNDSPFVIGSTVTVSDNVTLTLPAGAIIKFASGQGLYVYGTLDVNGVSGNPVIFTSLKDDSDGGDTNGDGGATSPAAGNWGAIRLLGSGANDGIGDFDWAEVRYGGGSYGNVEFDQSDSGHFTNSISEYSSTYGVKVYNCSSTFRGNRIQNNNSYGIDISGSSVPDLGANNPSDKGRNTIRDNNSGSYQVYNHSSNTVNAYYNFWVYTDSATIDSHIYDDNENPSLGQVLYEPWLTDDQSLPVVLSSFTAMTRDWKVILTWRTESEVNNIGFAIYRSESKDGNYTKIAFVDGAGNSAMPSDYQFTDKQVKSGHTYYYYLEDVDITGKRSRLDVIQVTINSRDVVTSVPLPARTELFPNYPNPFNPDTWLPYNLAKASDVTIQIYDVRGHLIRTLYPGHKPAGFYLSKDKAAYWNGRDNAGEYVGSGIYFYRLSAGDFSATRRMAIVK